jgi:hypothetical protein
VGLSAVQIVRGQAEAKVVPGITVVRSLPEVEAMFWAVALTAREEARRPEAGNSSALNLVISAMTPASPRKRQLIAELERLSGEKVTLHDAAWHNLPVTTAPRQNPAPQQLRRVLPPACWPTDFRFSIDMRA